MINIKTEDNKQITIALVGEFALDEVDKFRKEINEYFQQIQEKIIVDFSRCSFIDSTGLGVLVSLHKKCAENNKILELQSINDSNVKKVFKLTRLDKVFNIL
ncbi:STAS domain-containing protein [Sporosalibacterium faouarense]|uniref:STAS domain-containing protein n=1 Tax=Sporosalibacterium faouarense TaxID=516123 RepID=UPI00141D575E|nr:STAS domain-containing protein [Sporosalibacterium faouarense]MTI49344.1 STAS domain-containing protein [Bacillota bacterium]